ncbi:hypothetical protein MXD81_49310 [Microbacteriaceae bacterium K1510]|nr:hypothetical protein [Microbacteriaceae bacterium K1510]
MIALDGHSQRGAALFVTLLFAALISDLAVIALRTAQSGVFAASVYLDEMRADELGRAAVDLVSYQMSSSDPDARRGGSLFVRLGTSRVTVDYVSEAARIDVNMAPPRLIVALFMAVGADRQLATNIARRADQRRRSGRTPGTTDSLAVSLARPELIVDAWGVPAPLYRLVQPALTVASRSARVDATLADRLVIKALMEGDDTRTDEFMERRLNGFVNAQELTAQFPPQTRAFVGPAPAQAFRGVVRAIVSSRFERSYEFVVTKATGAGPPIRIISWQALGKRGDRRPLP